MFSYVRLSDLNYNTYIVHYTNIINAPRNNNRIIIFNSVKIIFCLFKNKKIRKIPNFIASNYPGYVTKISVHLI